MKKVFHFDNPRAEYRCDAAVLWCFDHRFELVHRKFLKWLKVENSDPIEIAGGAKVLASPEHESDREFILDQIQKSIRLHKTTRTIMMVHSDCGAYGGLAGGFKGDAAAEAIHHEAELRRAAEFLHQAIPGIEIEAYFVDFVGVWQVDLAKNGKSAP